MPGGDRTRRRRGTAGAAVLGALLCGALLSAPVAPAPDDAAPAPGHSTPGIGLESVCSLPPALRAMRGHLLFEYRVDARGQVQDVRELYASVQPEKDRGAFSAALAECVRQWAPHPERSEALAGRGAPPPLQRIPFHYFKPAPADDPVARAPDGHTYPVSWLEEMRVEKLRLAEWILKERAASPAAGGYRQIPGDGWVLHTRLGEAETAAVRAALEHARRVFETVFPAAPPVPEDAPLTVLVFSLEREFEELAAFDNLAVVPGSAGGRYTTWDRTIYAAVGDLPLPLIGSVLAHEATHHLVWHRLFGARERPPQWLNEGLAAFIQCVKPAAEGALDLAALDTGKISRGAERWSRTADDFLELLGAAAHAGRLPRLEDLLAGRLDERFAGREQRLHYAAAWLAVHYFLNADGGRHLGAFRLWSLDTGAGRGAEALAARVGRPLAEIEVDMRTYLESLLEAPGPRRAPPILTPPVLTPPLPAPPAGAS